MKIVKSSVKTAESDRKLR